MSQYIGARYTPDFQGTYVPTQSYENMVVVDNGMGTSYISKVPVPANTPLTNTDYWAIYGASNGAIINLQNQIDNIDQTEIPGLQNQIDHLFDRKYVFFGDSYGENYTSGGDDITGWIDILVGILGLSSDDYTKFATGGYGFLANNNSWNTPLSAMSQDDDVTDVLFIGGHNDAHYCVDSSNFPTAIINTITTAKSKFPNAKIWVGFCSIDLTGLDKTNKCRNLYSDVATRYGAEYMDVEFSIYKSNYILNDAHPNTLGNAVLAGAIASILKGGTYYNGSERALVVGVADANVQATSLSNYYYDIKDNEISFCFDSGNIISATFSSLDVAANASDEIILQKLPVKLPLHRAKVALGYVPVIMRWTNLQYIEGTAYLYTESGYLKCRLLALNSGNYVNAGHTDSLLELHFGNMRFDVDLIR